MYNLVNLLNKNILVTGASSGLGRDVSVLLSMLGARVQIVARNEQRLKETISKMEGDNNHLYCCDLANVASIEEMVKKVVGDNGKLDGIVHCAGIGTMKPLSSTKYDFMLDMMNTNLFSFIELVRVATKKSNFNERGSIIAVSSAASIRGDKAKVAYCTSKGALDSAMQAMAAELGYHKKIRVNTVNPAWIKTEMYYDYVDAVGEQVIKEIEERQFMGASEPREISNVIAFLLSDAASQITGQSIIVDGGRTIW